MKVKKVLTTNLDMSLSASAFKYNNFTNFYKKNNFFRVNFCSEIKNVDYSPLELNEQEFIVLGEKLLDSLHSQLDDDKLFEKITNLDYHDGVLDITVNSSKKYVLNLQRPNKQIWFSSPLSGPQRFELFISNVNKEKEWLNKRTFISLKKLLSEELTLLMDGKTNKNYTINLH
jgi:iron donor protein CyaY